MSDWWKNPVLQGEDNDYGQYDYLIEELPKDYAKWECTRWKRRCSSCGKERHLVFYSVHHFYCWDGWDSMDYTDCWKCRLESKLYSIKRKITLKIKVFKLTYELYKDGKKDLKYYYNLAKKIVK